MATIIEVDFKNKKVIESTKEVDKVYEVPTCIAFSKNDIKEVVTSKDLVEFHFVPHFSTKEGYEDLISWANTMIEYWNSKIQVLENSNIEDTEN